MEPVGVAGPICWTGSLNSRQPAVKGWSDEGMPDGSPMPKLVSFLHKGNNSTVDGVMIAYLLLVRLLDIYSG